MVVTLDYGQFSKEVRGDNWAVGNIVRRIYVGGVPRTAGSTSLVLNGLKGCVEVSHIFISTLLVSFAISTGMMCFSFKILLLSS